MKDTKQIKSYSHTTAFATHQRGSWRWQDRYQFSTYQRKLGADGIWRWRHVRVENAFVKPREVDYKCWTPHNKPCLAPETDICSPYNQDN